MTQYRIIGRFAKDTKPHVVDFDPKWTLADAENRLRELRYQEEQEKKQGRTVTQVGHIGVTTFYHPDYELLDLQIQSREVSPWQIMKY